MGLRSLSELRRSGWRVGLAGCSVLWWLPVWEWRRAVAEDILLRGWREEDVVRLVDMVWDGSKKPRRRREVVW